MAELKPVLGNWLIKHTRAIDLGCDSCGAIIGVRCVQGTICKSRLLKAQEYTRKNNAEFRRRFRK